MRKPKIKRPNIKNIKERLDKFSMDVATTSVHLKYKTLNALEKAKEALRGVEKPEEDYLSEEDYYDLQSDLAQLKSDFKEVPKEKEVQWEQIKTFSSEQKKKIVEEVFRSPNEYWVEEYKAVFNYYLKTHLFEELVYRSTNSGNIKLPLLTRLYSKIKETQYDNHTIFLISEVMEE